MRDVLDAVLDDASLGSFLQTLVVCSQTIFGVGLAADAPRKVLITCQIHAGIVRRPFYLLDALVHRTVAHVG